MTSSRIAQGLKTSRGPKAGSNAVQERPHAPDVARLGERDVRLLCDLFGHGALLRGQIQRLHFPSLRRCNRRLKQLFEVGCVARAPLPLGPQTALWSEGTPLSDETPGPGAAARSGQQGQFVYRLGSAAAPLVARRLGWEAAEVRSLLRPGTPTYLAHSLACADFRLALQGSMEIEGAYLARFLPERLARHAYEVREAGRDGALWRAEVFKPDAYFEVAFPATGEAAPETACFFVEVDLGHTSAREFLTKLRIHGRYRAAGLFARRYGAADFRTLVVTTGPGRRDHLRRIVEEQGTDLFWLTTFREVAERGAFSTVWHLPLTPAPLALRHGWAARRPTIR